MAVTPASTPQSGVRNTREPLRPIRVVTSTALFDGHDAAINVMRRILQDQGGEVIHLGHNRSATEIVHAAIQEDAAAIAISSYQGGHMHFFRYVVDLLRERDAAHIQVFGGGGGTIVPREIRELQTYGVNRIYSPEDGRKLGLVPMIQDLLARAGENRPVVAFDGPFDLQSDAGLARVLTAVEEAQEHHPEVLDALMQRLPLESDAAVPVLGVTGTGGAGKSSLVDELVLRFVRDFPQRRVGVLSIDPTKRKTGGALLGDRIRMNTASHPRVFMRSLATRERHSELSSAIGECLAVMKSAGFDLIIAETAGIGQGDAGIVPYADVSLYVMTAEFGSASQLEKIDMFDFADIVAINKYDRAGADDALRDVRKQLQRVRQAWATSLHEMPVYGTTASRFNDDGVTALYLGVIDALRERKGVDWESAMDRPATPCSSERAPLVAQERARYLADIADCIRAYHRGAQEQATAAREVWHLDAAARLLPYASAQTEIAEVRARLAERLTAESKRLLDAWPKLRAEYEAEEFVYHVRGREHRVPAFRESLSGLRIPKVALPKDDDPGAILAWQYRENVPGAFPYTAGVFPLKRTDEDPARMFAGEGDAQRTNERFHFLSKESPAKRLSTAFDSVTLYGWDPEERPDIYGKVGSAGVSICTLDDMKVLYSGFDLTSPNTSVSMTINGPAPMILAMFFNTAIDQALDVFERENERPPNLEEAVGIRAEALRQVRGTVQADILKEDQGQNTCIFGIDFALRMMGDIQAYFIEHHVRNFYSVSISGYHIAEAGANPIHQLAFTLSNAFTFVEHYIARGMDVNEFAPNLSFFFSVGMDPEYTVLNRVARRIWAVAMRDRYGANERAQKLKTHIQTSGRSLHAQEIAFNDIRTTLEALMALYDNCNSLHTNAYDEAITTPTEASVRRALAIQLIINKEHGLAMSENPLQGSFVVDELTDLVEEAVLKEFEQISARGGVLGAMERGYQRGKIQEDSHRYEHLKALGLHPVVGVNTFVDPNADHEAAMDSAELRRGTEAEIERQLARLDDFHARHTNEAPQALARLRQVALDNGNIFAELMHTVRVCSLGQITQTLFEAGGQYRRNT